MKPVPEKGATHENKSHDRPQERTAPLAASPEHCRLLVLALKIVVEDIMRAIWSVIESIAYCVEFEYPSHV